MFLRVSLLVLVATLLPAPLHAAGSKEGKAQVSFHLQAEVGDAPKMIYPLMVGERRVNFKRMPEVQTKDVASYKAIPSKTQAGIYDIVIKLKPHAAERLQLMTNANRGRFMASQLNGRTGEAMLINQQVNDGVLVIWGVATAADLETLAKAIKGSVETQ